MDGQVKIRRWLLVAMLGLATFAMHALLTGATPRELGAPATEQASAVDFRLPPFASEKTSAGDAAPTASAPAAAAPVANAGFLSKTPTAQAGRGPVKVSAKLDRQAVLRGTDGRFYAELLIEGEAPKVDRRLPTDLIVVLDHSSSMSGRKIEEAKQATIDLMNRLDESDTFALVTFSGHAEVRIERTRALPQEKSRWRELVRGIHSGGSTDMVGGLNQALAVLRDRQNANRPCRVLLLSDGHPNTTDGLDLQARMAGRLGAALSSLGVGEDFNETLMGHLADLGTGNYYFLDRPERIAAVFAGELEAGRGTIAQDLRIAFSPQNGVELVEAAGYPLEKTGEVTILRPGHLFAGQTRRLWLTLQTDASRDFASRSFGRFEVSWHVDGHKQTHELGQGLKVACVTEKEKYFSGVDADAWGRAVISEEYGRLQSEVASFVRSGQEAEAKRTIESYIARQSKQNAYLQNADVSSNLASIEELKQQVDAAFTGADQSRKQKLLSKRQHMVANELRRID